jgi:hypothetical protein
MGCTELTLEQHTTKFTTEQKRLKSIDSKVLEMHKSQQDLIERELSDLIAEYEPSLLKMVSNKKKLSPDELSILNIRNKRMKQEKRQFQRQLRNLEINIARVVLQSGKRRAVSKMGFAARQENIMYGTTNVRNLDKAAKDLFIKHEKEVRELEITRTANEMKDEKADEMFTFFLDQNEESLFDDEKDDEIMIDPRREAKELLVGFEVMKLPPPKNNDNISGSDNAHRDENYSMF